jgi:hypothetical protein
MIPIIGNVLLLYGSCSFVFRYCEKIYTQCANVFKTITAKAADNPTKILETYKNCLGSKIDFSLERYCSKKRAIFCIIFNTRNCCLVWLKYGNFSKD